jgi:hypothetical protein
MDVMNMRPLQMLRTGWSELQQEEQRLARHATIQESVNTFLSLYCAFAPLVGESRELFRPQREAFLAELQARLRRLEVWRLQHGDITKPA